VIQKIILLLACIGCLMLPVTAQTFFYSKSTGAPNLTSTWGMNTDGSGTAPSNFTANNQVFIVSNNNTDNLNASWTVSGTGSKVLVGNGVSTQTLNTSTFTITGIFDVANLGVLNVQSNSTALVIGTCATGSTVIYGFDGTQSVIGGTYYHLTLTNASAARTKTASGTITVNGDLAVNTNNTFALTTFQLLGVNGVISGNGTITTTNTSALPIPAGKTWTQNITYSSTSLQTVVKGVYNLALNVAGAAGSRTFPAGGDTIEVKGAFTASGASITYTTTGTRFVFSGGAQTLTLSATSAFNFGNVVFTGTTVSKTVATAGFSADTLNVASSVTLAMSTLALSGTLNIIVGNGIITTSNLSATPIPSGKTWTQTVNYTGATQTIVAGTYASLTYAAGAKTASGNIVVNTLLTSTGSLDMGSNLLSGTFTNSGTGTITTSNTSSTPIPAGKTWTQAISYNASSNQTVVKGIYAGALTLTGNSSSATRTFPANSDTIEVRAAFTAANTSGVSYSAPGTRFLFTTASKTITFNPGSSFNFGYVIFSGAFTNTIAGSGFSADTLNVASGCTLNMVTFDLSGTLNSTIGTGTIQTQSTSATPLAAGKTWSQAILYNSSNNQTVVKGIYAGALTITGTTAGATRTFPNNSDTIEVRAAFTAANTSGVNYVASGTRFLFTTASKTITLNAGSTFSFGHVIFSGAFTNTMAGNGFSADTINVGTGCTLNMVTFVLSGTLNSNTGTGTIQTQNTSASPIPAGKTWDPNIIYSATGSQNVVKGIYKGNLVVTSGPRVFPSGGDTVEIRGNFTANSATTYTTTGTRFIFSTNTQTLTFISTGVFNFGYVSFTGNTTKTIGGAGFSVDTLNVGSSTTLNMVTFAIGGNVLLTTGTGTITTQATSAVPINKIWKPLVNYNLDNTQNIIGGVYDNLSVTIFATARTKTATGDITVNNQLLVSSTGAAALTFSMSTFRLIDGGAFVLTNSGTAAKNFTTLYTNTDTTFKPLPMNQTWPGIVTYSAALHQTVVPGTYTSSLLVNNGPRTFSAIGTISVAGTFTATTASTTYTCTGSSFVFSGGTQTLTFVATSPFVFTNVSFTGNSVTKTIGGTGFTVNGVLNIDTTVTLNMATFALLGSPTVISGTGIIATQYIGTTPLTPIPAGKTWTQTINYNSSSNQNIAGGRYANLMLTLTGTSSRSKTALDSITLDQSLTFNSTSTGVITLAMGVYRLIDGGGAIVVNAGAALKSVSTNYTNQDTAYKPLPSNQTWPGAVTYASAAHQTVVSGVYSNNLIVTGGSRTFSAMGVIEVKTTFTANTASTIYSASGTTFLFSGGAQTLTFSGTSPFNFEHVFFTGSNVTKTIGGAGFGVNGMLNVSSTVTLNMVTFAMAGNPTVVSGSGTIATQNTSATPLPLGETWTQTVNYNANANQSIVGGVYEKLGLIGVTSSTRVKTATGHLQVNDTFTLSTTGTAIISIQMLTYSLINGGNFKLINNGTTARNINTQSLDTLPLPSGITWPVVGTISYDATSGTQIVSKGTYTNLTLSNAAAKVAEGSFTVRGTLNITSPNASIYRGALHMGTDTLWLDTATATFTGTGDVSGVIRRTGVFSVGVPYRFGNTYSQLTLLAGGIVPTEMMIRVRLGDSLSWKGTGMLRQYEMTQTNGTGSATIQLHYLSAELNGNVETRMVIWEDSNGTVIERGRSTINTTNKFVEFANVPLLNYAAPLGNTQTGFARTAQPEVNWVGVTSTAWSTASNWDPTFVPDSTDDVIIPDGSTTPFSPTLPAVARVKTLSIDSNAVLTGASGAQLTVFGGTTIGLSSWDCNGTFIPSTSTVTFLGGDATFSGTTDFYNIVIADTAVLSNRESSIMRIGNNISNLGIWRVAAFNETTVEYNKNGSQTVVEPNGISVSGYYNLIISGTGTKTFPASLNLKGDLLNTGTMNVNTLSFTGNVDQQISSNGPLSIAGLTINSSHALSVNVNTTIIDSLNISSGILNLNGNNLNLSGIVTGPGTISCSPTTNLSITGSGPMGTLNLTGGFETIGDITIDRTSAGSVALGNDFIVDGSVTLTNGQMILGPNQLILNGNFTGSANNNLVGDGNTSSIQISGTGSIGSLFFDQTTPGLTNRINKLILDRSGQTITLGNELEIIDELNPMAGTLASAGNLTLVSSALHTAHIASGNCSTCSYITGNVKVQRFIPALARRWRFIGSPVVGNTVADWQNEVYITGAGGAANGFDATPSNYVGIYSYDETVITGDLNSGYMAPANTSQLLGMGKGYRVFIRGDRSDSSRLYGTNTTQNAVTIDAVGIPYQGDILMPVTCTFSGPGPMMIDSNDGWNLLANPYAAAYDWDAHFNQGNFQTNIDPTIWIFNAQTNGYVSYNAMSHDGDLENGLIPSGASFWVKANDASPSLTFKEQFKSALQPTALFKTGDGESFKIKLLYDLINSDAVIIKYAQDASENYDQFDTRKLPGTVSISAYGNDRIQLALSVRPTTFEVDTIKLKVAGAAGNYKLVFNNSDKIAIKDNVWLFDTYLNTVTNLLSTNIYPFSLVSGVPSSGGPDRFYILIGNTTSLPVKLIQFTAVKNGNRQVRLNWSTAQEMGNDQFLIERSADGKNYETIGLVAGNSKGAKVMNYEWMDNTPLAMNYYRLKQVDRDGTVDYSAIRMVLWETTQQQFSMYPIPANDILNISHTERIVSMKISDLSGNELLKLKGDNQTETLQIGMLEAGVYILTIMDETGNERSEKFVKR
jgi:hypothetical protein